MMESKGGNNEIKLKKGNENNWIEFLNKERKDQEKNKSSQWTGKETM